MSRMMFPELAKLMSQYPEVRTRNEVIALQSSMVGCCERYANMQGCDCLEKAIAEEKGDAWEPGRD